MYQHVINLYHAHIYIYCTVVHIVTLGADPDPVPGAVPGVPAITEREFFIDNLLVRIYLIIEMILVDRPCTMGFLNSLFQVA